MTETLILIGVGLACILAAVVVALLPDRPRIHRKPASLQPLWLQWEDCHDEIGSGVTTMTGIVQWGGHPDTIHEFTREWQPPFEAQISANGRDMDIIVTDLTVTYGSRDVRWRGQDKRSYMADRTFR